jgi:hypothetical protein
MNTERERQENRSERVLLEIENATDVISDAGRKQKAGRAGRE